METKSYVTSVSPEVKMANEVEELKQETTKESEQEILRNRLINGVLVQLKRNKKYVKVKASCYSGGNSLALVKTCVDAFVTVRNELIQKGYNVEPLSCADKNLKPERETGL